MSGRIRTIAVAAGLLSLLAIAGPSTAPAAAPLVSVERLPGGGIQPQAVADGSGIVHVVYFRGNDGAGDLFYVRRSTGGAYSTPLRVNSQPGSAIATGSVRGAQLALGRNNRVHVIWNGSNSAAPKMTGGLPLFYSRLTGGAFEPQRNLLTWSGAVDGGGTLAADAAGHVFVAWHANPDGGTDARRTVFLTRSDNDGGQFERERGVSSQSLGACACCSMRALIDRGGVLHLLYRAAGQDVNRDSTLLSSRDLGATFKAMRLHPWKIAACPLTTSALADAPAGVTAAWETDGQVFMQRHIGAKTAAAPEPAPGRTGGRKHPVLAANARGETLLAWLEGTGWARGGSLAWQLYDASGKPAAAPGSARGVPTWGLAAAAPLDDGRFLLLY